MVRTLQRLRSAAGLAAVAVPAAVAAHCAGYELAARLETLLGPLGGGGAHHGGHHGAIAVQAASTNPHAHHLPLIPLTTGALLVGALTVLSSVLAFRRVGGLPRLRLGPLVAAQAAVLVAIELPGIVSGLATAPASAMVLGIAAQFPVALVVLALAQGARRLAASLVTSRRSLVRPAATPLRILVTAELQPTSTWAAPAVGRAPPWVVVTL